MAPLHLILAIAVGNIDRKDSTSTAELASQLRSLEQRFDERLSRLESENAALRTQQRASQLASSASAESHLPEFSSTMRTFGTVVCNATEVIGGRETTVYEYEASGNSPVSALTHWQFTANGTFEPWTVRMYIDGEATASVVISEWMGGACESCGWGLLLPPDRPWGVERLGKGSAWPGLYCNWRVPFARTLRVTVQAKRFAVFFSILRGAEGVSATAGGLSLPPQARLRIQSMENVSLQPLELAQVATSQNKSGVLAMWTLTVASLNANFLEACTRVHADGQNMWFIGDGEDFFDSAWYFNGGAYTFPQAGVTYLCGGGTCPAHKGWPLGGCANPEGCWGQNGGDINLQPCNASSALQQWVWKPPETTAASDTQQYSWGAWVLGQSGDSDYSLSCVMDNVNHCGPGDPLHLWTNDRTPNQQWSASERPRPDGTSGRFRDALNNSMCVTARGGSTIEMAACGKSLNQQWNYNSNGLLQSLSNPGMCITGSGFSSFTSNSTPGNIVSA